MTRYLFVLLFAVSFRLFAQDSTVIKVDSVQMLLDKGVTPKELLSNGISKDSLYGKVYEGGHIFYFFDDSTGMVMGTEFLNYPYAKDKIEIIWSCRGVETGAKDVRIGAGMTNSKKIKDAACTLYDPDERKWMYTAAEICLEYKGGGKDDWFLPSREELHQAWLQLAKTNKVDFQRRNIWSSTEKNKDLAWIQAFSQGERDYDRSGHSYYMKFHEYFVRPVRVFKYD